MVGRSSIGLQDPSPLGERDEVYYWDTARFLVEGYAFKLPKYQFVVGSEYFARTYLQGDPLSIELDPDDDWDSMEATDPLRMRMSTAGTIELQDVTAAQFRTFLKLLFPMHSTTTTLTMTRSEWLTILTLSTHWHFLEFRKLALSHLNPQMDEAIEMITVGRRDFVPEWVLSGYEKLVTKEEAISEEESEQIGYRTAVKLYIVRHDMVNYEGGRDMLEETFADEVAMLRAEERTRRTKSELRAEEELKRKMEEDILAKEQEERRAREAEEEERRVREAEAEERRVKEAEAEERRVKEADEKRVREEQSAREAEERRRKEEEEQRAKEEEEQRVMEAEIEMHRIREEEAEQRRAMEEQERRAIEEEAERQAREEEKERQAREEKERHAKEDSDKRGNGVQLRAKQGDRELVTDKRRNEGNTDVAAREDMGRKVKEQEERVAEEKRRKEEERNAAIERHLQEELSRLMFYDEKRRRKEEQRAEYERLRRIAADEERVRLERHCQWQQQFEADGRNSGSLLVDIIGGIGRMLPHMPAPAPSEAEKAAWEASFKKPW